MSFRSFQNDAATLNRYKREFNGDMTLVEQIPVECDVQFEYKRIISRDGEEVTTSAAVFVTPNEALLAKSMKDLRQQPWRLAYGGDEHDVEAFDRIRKPGRDQIDHFELRLR